MKLKKWKWSERLKRAQSLLSKIEDIILEIKNLSWNKLDRSVKSALCNLPKALGGII